MQIKFGKTFSRFNTKDIYTGNITYNTESTQTETCALRGEDICGFLE